ncbi:IQ domain-containing protein K-like [Leptinotarsa decemlineata]|uniref:IQ domain-containing protein K-like n=1 Tax=Leptinotarsa decemlineata TaxID=7539 RepID=UPI003D30759B
MSERIKSLSNSSIEPSIHSDKPKNSSLDSLILSEIFEDYDSNIKKIQEYMRSKTIDSHLDPNPAVGLLEDKIFPHLRNGMCKMLKIIREENSYIHPKSTFNGLDFLSEYLYNVNPAHPERKQNWTYIFDMDWVVSLLKQNPRPYFPLHLIWNETQASTKLQSFVRGYRGRRNADIQEIREFWKYMKQKKKLSQAYRDR